MVGKNIHREQAERGLADRLSGLGGQLARTFRGQEPSAGPRETPEEADRARSRLMQNLLEVDSFDAASMVAALAERSQRSDAIAAARPLEPALARAHQTRDFADYRARRAEAAAAVARSLASPMPPA